MKNKEQILVVPVNYTSYIKNGFTGTSSVSTKSSYSLYDSTGVYEPRYKIDNNICLIKVSILIIIKYEDKYLVKELYDTNKRPCLELGINSYIKNYSGNYNALYNQIIHIINNDLKIDPKTINIDFIGYIRDLANDSVKSVLGNIYYINITNADMIISKSKIYNYKWYTLKELIDRYTKATTWSKTLIDCLVEKTIKVGDDTI